MKVTPSEEDNSLQLHSVMSDSLQPIDCQDPLSMGFSRKEYWSGLPFPSSGDLPDPGIKPGSPALQADSLPPEPLGHSASQSVLKFMSIESVMLSSNLILCHPLLLYLGLPWWLRW